MDMMEVQVKCDAWLGSEGHEAFDALTHLLVVVSPGAEQGNMASYFYFARKHYMVMGYVAHRHCYPWEDSLSIVARIVDQLGVKDIADADWSLRSLGDSIEKKQQLQRAVPNRQPGMSAYGVFVRSYIAN